MKVCIAKVYDEKSPKAFLALMLGIAFRVIKTEYFAS